MLTEIERDDVDKSWLSGGIALVCSYGKLINVPDKRMESEYPEWGFQQGTGRGGNLKFWYSDWTMSGSKLISHDERKFGPILFVQYTLSKRVLKMTAQLPPIGNSDDKIVDFQIKDEEEWKTISMSEIDPLARTANFKVENWNIKNDIPYRIVYRLISQNDNLKDYYYEGIIRKEPWEKKEIVVAAFTGNNDLGFPNNDIFSGVLNRDPDILFFSGDQIYEGVGGYGVQRSPIEKSTIDYLRKWYLYGWAYRDLMRDRPTIAIPDDQAENIGTVGEAIEYIKQNTKENA